MEGMPSKLRLFMEDESGATAIEYGLIAALVSVAVIGSLRSLGTSLTNMFSSVDSALQVAGAADSNPPPPNSGDCSPAQEAAGEC